MTGIGTSGLVSGALQLGVPSYGLRLVRRFGVQRSGWFLVAAFSCLALLHFVEPLSYAAAPEVIATWDAVYAIGSLLLLIGMGHIETVCSERESAQGREERLRGELNARLREERAGLARANEELSQELSRRGQSEQALRDAEQQYRLLFMENPLPMWIFELRSCRLLAANQAALRQYGFSAEEFLSLTARDLVAPQSAADFLRDSIKPCPALESRGIWKHCRKDGVLLDVQVKSMDVKFCGAAARLMMPEDLGPARRRQIDLQREQKMAAIGQTAAGVAFHLGNLFSGIEANVLVLQNRMTDAKCVRPLQEISAAATRASVVTRQLLAAGGRQTTRIEPLDLNDLVRSLNPVIYRLAGARVAVHNACGSTPLLTMADQRLVQQIVLNLVLNACEAIPEHGNLDLSTARIRIDEAQAREHQVAPGQFVRLSIHDTGTGMHPDVQARVFEPFFTTKDPNKAAGLGLAGVYGAVRQQGGWIEFNSEPGLGTEFRIFLPAASGPATPEAQRACGSVLLIEPDDRVRGLARAVLERQGYRVIEADCAALALMFWEQQAPHVNLVLTELDLPDEISGTDLASKFLEKNPGMKVIFMASRERAAGLAGRQGVKFIPKPFTPASLLQELEQQLSPGI